MTKIKDITQYLEQIAPLAYQEDYDNCGLLTGQGEQEIKKILITLDVTEEVIEEAHQSGCNLIIAHHPIIFKGLKKINGNNYVERCIISAIKKDIALYAIHTNLDHAYNGVNFKIAEKIGLQNVKILAPKADTFMKLVTFIPEKEADQVLKALHEAGAGNIGDYSECSFRLSGTGTFKPGKDANPHTGIMGKKEQVAEIRAEVIFPSHLEKKLIQTLKKSHPYEEPAFDIYTLVNRNPETGAGAIGELPAEMDSMAFLNHLKTTMNLSTIRHTKPVKKIKKVAVCGGAGSFLLKNALSAQADAFVSADFKYHEFFDAENRILIADIGHYESEVFTKDLIYEFLIKKFSNIAVALSKSNTNPISYL